MDWDCFNQIQELISGLNELFNANRLDGTTSSTDMNLSKLQEIMRDREA